MLWRVSEFKAPPLVERSSLPPELQTPSTILSKVAHAWSSDYIQGHQKKPKPETEQSAYDNRGNKADRSSENISMKREYLDSEKERSVPLPIRSPRELFQASNAESEPFGYLEENRAHTQDEPQPAVHLRTKEPLYRPSPQASPRLQQQQKESKRIDVVEEPLFEI